MNIENIKELVIPSLAIIGSTVVSVASAAKDRRLIKQNRKLKEKIRLLTELTLQPDGIYYNKDKLPFCPACFAKGKIIPLRNQGENHSHDCPACPAAYSPKFL